MTYTIYRKQRQHLRVSARRCCLAFMAVAMLSACENVISIDEDETPEAEEGYARVTISGNISGAGYDTEARSGDGGTVSLTDNLCSRFDIAVYKGSERISKDAQKAGDGDFGTFTANLEIGTEYKIVAIAHSCAEAMTTTDINKITADREVTDMFWACETVTPTEDMDLSITLRRIVAKVLFRVEEATPANVASMYFYYTGGSSTFDGETGLGSVNSKQNVTIETPSTAYAGESEYAIYTIPRADSEALDLTVKAFDADGGIVKSTEFPSVKIQQNHITRYSGKFFSEEPETDPDKDKDSTTQKSTFSVQTDWDATDSYSY